MIFERAKQNVSETVFENVSINTNEASDDETLQNIQLKLSK
jgi:hypothetical protein